MDPIQRQGRLVCRRLRVERGARPPLRDAGGQPGVGGGGFLRIPLEMRRGPEKPVLIYDGECPVCRGAVEWIRARSGPEHFELLSCPSEALPLRFPPLGS